MGNNILITIGSLIVLGLFTLSSNTMITQNTQIMLQSEHYITAIALAQSLIDEAKTKSFDEKTANKSVAKPESLTTMASLGSDGAAEAIGIDYVDLSTTKRVINDDSYYIPGGQTVIPSSGTSQSQTKYDDVDDYNYYTRIVKTPGSGVDTIRTIVTYASITYPDSAKSTQTFCKKMKIVISGQYLPRPFTLEYAYIY
ncbi:MAG: hypothetical protein HYZ33_04290 [Ignavibacteriales bacterium]|nr:hypothetical protein [Ignavibacteriales bacterium]